MGSTRLLFLRHAHTNANVIGDHVQMSGGWADIGLSDLGRQQVELVARDLSFEGDLAAIYASPLRRAQETVAGLAQRLELGVVIRERLREIDCGAMDGLWIAEVKRRYPGAWAANQRQDDPDFAWPGGESYRAFRERCLAEVEAIAAAHRGEQVLVVTHTGVVSQVVGFLRGASAACWECYRPGNASITEIAWDQRAGRLVRFDDRAHLDPAHVKGAVCRCW